MSPRVFLTSREHMSTRTSPYVNNSVLISLLHSHFIEKKYFCGNTGTYKIGGAPAAYRPRGRSLKIHIEIKKGSCLHMN
jgi:hypothetical protein